ncbi:hypothetical protein PENSPDRAFT_754615 [Peniophora sp. CONT]|nr:hypothetical protein PENSPDRAFT_754615 [Peniophora sp. CONT]
MACKIFGLAATVGYVLPDVTSRELQCSANGKILSTTSDLALVSTTTLLFVRVGAVWRWDKRVTAMFALMQTINIALGIRAIVHFQSLDAVSSTTKRVCRPSGFHANLPYAFTTLATDLGLLCMLLIGLWRWGHARALGLWHLLWNHGLMYLGLCILIEIPYAVSLVAVRPSFPNLAVRKVFLLLDFDDFMSIMFSVPPAVILPIAATRFYRSLTSFTDSRQIYESIVVPPSSSKPRATNILRKPHLSAGIGRGYEEDGDVLDTELESMSHSL